VWVVTHTVIQPGTKNDLQILKFSSSSYGKTLLFCIIINLKQHHNCPTASLSVQLLEVLSHLHITVSSHPPTTIIPAYLLSHPAPLASSPHHPTTSTIIAACLPHPILQRSNTKPRSKHHHMLLATGNEFC
jgi:hypothetical protein